MKILRILVLLSVILHSSISDDGSNQLVAKFANNGIVGNVTVDYGSVTVYLDLSSQPDIGTYNFSSCIKNGLKYHIHEFADNITESLTCGSSFTGGHYDPWSACGPATGNEYCSICINDTYSCDLDMDPYSCEIGDWSSKYGMISIDQSSFIGTGGGSSFYEVIPSDINGMSVVFHCSDDGSRAFCAKFESGNEHMEDVPAQDGGVDVAAYFDVFSDDSQIVLKADGSVSILLEITSDNINFDDYNCNNFEYTIWTPDSLSSGYDDMLSLYGTTACSGVIDAQFDPTHQCLPKSDSYYCSDTLLCDDSDYDYLCDFDTDRYSCAPGDLSGKFGLYDSSIDQFTYNNDESVTLLPPTNDIIGYTIAIHCPIDDPDNIQILACGEIIEYIPDIMISTTGVEDGDSGVIQISLILSFGILIAQILF